MSTIREKAEKIKLTLALIGIGAIGCFLLIEFFGPLTVRVFVLMVGGVALAYALLYIIGLGWEMYQEARTIAHDYSDERESL